MAARCVFVYTNTYNNLTYILLYEPLTLLKAVTRPFGRADRLSQVLVELEFYKGRLQFPPGFHLAGGGTHRPVAAIDDRPILRTGARQAAPIVQTGKIAFRKGRSGFDFVSLRPASLPAKQIDLVAGAVAPEGERRFQAPVIIAFEKLVDHQVLEQTAPQIMGVELVDVADFEQRAGQPRVVKVEFGRLDEPLGEIVVVGPQEVENVALLQDRKPRIDGRRRYAALDGQRSLVEQLTDSSGAQLDEPPEFRQVADRFHLPHVAFDVGFDVVRIVVGRFDLPVVQARVGALEDFGVDGCRSDPGGAHLLMRKGQQGQNPDAPGQRLIDGLHQFGVLRPSEDVHAGLPFVVGMGLEIGEQARDALHLVDDGPGGVGGDESAGIFGGEGAVVQVFQRDAVIVRKGHLGKGRFAGLPGAGDGHKGVFCSELPQLVGQGSVNHGSVVVCFVQK